jgi:hypothetical protein
MPNTIQNIAVGLSVTKEYLDTLLNPLKAPASIELKIKYSEQLNDWSIAYFNFAFLH